MDRIPPPEPMTPFRLASSAPSPRTGKEDRGAVEGVLISLPCFLSEQISELLCIGDILPTEHFGQVKDSRASGRVFRLFLEIRLVEFINKEIPL